MVATKALVVKVKAAKTLVLLINGITKATV
jgi:hypothetical protein